MDLTFYKLIHILGLLLVFVQLGGAAVGGMESPWRKTHSTLHGLGLLLMLVGGFGMLAKLDIGFPWPGWVWAKLTIWLLLGASATLIRKVPEKSRLWLALGVLLGTLAAFMALYKPF
jgi:hypothetical protein